MRNAVQCIIRWAKHKAIWRNLNKKLKDKRCKALVPLIVCTLRTMLNAFKKRTSVCVFGKMAKQLAFNLHAWFKVYFCCSLILQPFDFAVIFFCVWLFSNTRFKAWLLYMFLFYQNKALQKFWKMLFISPKKFFPFSSYRIFCIFFTM